MQGTVKGSVGQINKACENPVFKFYENSLCYSTAATLKKICHVH